MAAGQDGLIKTIVNWVVGGSFLGLIASRFMQDYQNDQAAVATENSANNNAKGNSMLSNGNEKLESNAPNAQEKVTSEVAKEGAAVISPEVSNANAGSNVTNVSTPAVNANKPTTPSIVK